MLWLKVRVRTGGGDGRKPHGLDVRGADLSGVDLSHLPLVRLRAGLSLEEGRHATVEQSRQAAANLAKADLSYAQLQGAQFGWATLDEAVLVEAHLEGADLGKASLKHVMSLCLRKGGARADNGDQHDANFRDYIPFYEYFHGESGRGVGASHQTGWTAVVANLLQA